MKVTTFFLFAMFFQVSAAVFSQNSGLISLKADNESVREILLLIEDQSKYRFLYNSNNIDVEQKKSIDCQAKSIEEVLDLLFKGTGIKYRSFERNYVLYRKDRDLLMPARDLVTSSQQQRTVSGKVTDSDGQPLPGVSIVIKGTTQGTVTNTDGEYTLTNVPPAATLVFSFVGMRTQEIVVGNQSTINVTMEEETIGIEEVVAIGYGTQKKVNLTGSVGYVDSEDFENRALESVVEALQGTTPNLNMMDTGLGDEPGTKNKTINIRGTGTLTGNGGEPYIVVDGMPMDIYDLDPEDIESVSVLKDAAASAIYGARAPYGVILITTKRGKLNERITAEYSNTTSWAHPTIIPNSANSVDYAKTVNVACENSGTPPLYPEDYMNRIIAYANGEIDYETIPREDNPKYWGHHGANGGHANNDGNHLFWDNWPLRHKHNLSLRGGTHNTSFFASAGYYDEDGMMTWGDEYHQKYNVILNLNSNVADWIKISLNTKYIRNIIQKSRAPKNLDIITQWRFAAVLEPTTPLYSPDGDIIMHPARELAYGGKDRRQENNNWLKLGTELEPFKNWNTNISYTWNNKNSRETIHNKTIDYPLVPKGEYYVWRYPTPGFFENYSDDIYYMFNARSSYKNSFDNHNIFAMVGYEQEVLEYRGMDGYKADLITNEVPSIRTAIGEVTLNDTWGHWATKGIFVRLFYNFMEKYLIEFNARYDGSSRFENSDTQWGFFPSVSLGYNISKEPFWENIEESISMNYFKIRASYGSLGNQNVPNYSYIPILRINSNLDWEFGGSRPSYGQSPNLISTSLTWETVNTFNIGTDAGFFNNRLILNFDWYERKTIDMFGPSEVLPSVLGANPSLRNNAELSTKGFDLSVSWHNSISNDIKYSLRFIISDNKSKVIKYNNPNKLITAWYEGQTLGEIWGYETIGYFKEGENINNHADQSAFYPKWREGDIKYRDLDGNGIINWGNNTLDNVGDQKIIGNSTPRYQFGFITSMNYKLFDLRVFLQGVGKRDYYIPNRFGFTFFGFRGNSRFNNIYEEHLDYWSPEDSDYGGGPDAYYPRPYVTSEHFKNTRTQTKYLQNLAYLRLKNIQIGYTLPQFITNIIKIHKARIFVTGNNILTYKKLAKFLDPEGVVEDTQSLGIGSYYPFAKSYSIGINLTF